MSRALPAFLLLVALASIQVWALNQAAAGRKNLPVSDGDAYVLPAPLLKVAALEYKGVVADALLLKSLVFIGRTMERGGRTSELPQGEWNYLFEQLRAASALDPYFRDPYYIGSGALSTQPSRIGELNRYLEDGVRYRSWDWFLPFLVGWHKFYYLQDNQGAAESLMEAYKRDTRNTLLATLAARLAYAGNNTETAILFLQEILAKTEDPDHRKTYETRLQALIGISVLEKASAMYQQRHRILPATPADLVKAGILKKLPQDPYGGEFYFRADGSVATTSNLIEK